MKEMFGSPSGKLLQSMDDNRQSQQPQKSATQVISEAVAENKASHFKFEHEKNVPN